MPGTDPQNPDQGQLQADMRAYNASPEGKAAAEKKRNAASEQAISDFAKSSVLPTANVENMLRELRGGQLDIQDASKQTDQLAEKFFADSLASGVQSGAGTDLFKLIQDDPFIRSIREEKSFADDPANQFGGKALVEAATKGGMTDPGDFALKMQTVAALPPKTRDELVQFSETLKTPEERKAFESFYFRAIDNAADDVAYGQELGRPFDPYSQRPRDPLGIEDSDGNFIPWASATDEQKSKISFEKGNLESGEYRQWFIDPKEADVVRKWEKFRGENPDASALHAGLSAGYVGPGMFLTREELGNVISKKDSLFTKVGLTAIIGKALSPLPNSVTSKLAAIGAPIYNTDIFLDASLSSIDDALAHPLRTLDRETETVGRTAEGAVEVAGYGGVALINDLFDVAHGDANFSNIREYRDYAQQRIDQLGGSNNINAYAEFFQEESKRINIGDVTPLPDWVDGGAPLRFIAVPSNIIGLGELARGAKLGFKPAGALVKIPIEAFVKMAPESSYRIAAWWAAKAAPRAEVLARLQSEVGAVRGVPQFSQGLEAPVNGIVTTTGEEVLYRGIGDVANITKDNPLANGQMLGGRTVVNLTPAMETATQFATDAGDILMARLPKGLRIIDSASTEHADIIKQIVESPEYAAVPVEAGGTAKQAFRDAVMEQQGIAGVLIHKDGHPIVRLFDQSLATVVGSRKLDGPINSGNKFVEHLRPLDGADGIVAEVTSIDPGKMLSNHSIIRFLVGRTGINPSILRYTPVGRLVTAYARQIGNAEALTGAALSKAFDRHAQMVTGKLIGTSTIGSHVFQISEEGRLLNVEGKVKGLPLHWNDVFRAPDKYVLTANQRAMINDVVQTVREAEDMRALAGLTRRNIVKDGFYIPRQVKGIKGVILEGVSDPNMKRLFDTAEDGLANGIKYERDIRAVLELHIKTAYQEVAEKQLSDAVAQYGVKATDLVDNGLANRFLETATVLNNEKALGRATLKGQEELVASLSGAARNSAAGRLETMRVAEIARIAELEKNAKPVFAQYRAAVKKAAKTEVAPGSLFGKTQERIGIKQWHGSFFPREDVTELTRMVDNIDTNAQGFVWRQIDRVGNTTRYLASVGDFAAPFVQGLPVLARDPVAWSRATFAHYMAFLDPTVSARFAEQHRATYVKAAKYGMAMGDDEFFRGATVTGGFNIDALLKKLPQIGDPITNARQGLSRQTFGRFQASYNAFLIQSRVLVWEGMEESWTRNGGKLSDLAAHINNLSGGLDPRALGVSANRRSFEGMWMAFSPRLLRSTVGLIADLKFGLGNPRGRSAFVSLGRLVTGAVGVYSAASMAKGMSEGQSGDEILTQIKEGLNPLNGKKFLSLEVNGDWIGIGGQIRAITQLMSGVAASGLNSPMDLVSTDFQKNPLAQFWLNRGAPGPSVLGAIGEGVTSADLLPYENVDGLPDIALHIGRSALPFAVQSRLEGQNWSSVAFSTTGLRTSRETTSEARNTAARQQNPYPASDPRYADVERLGYRGLEEAERLAFDSAHAGTFSASQNVPEQVKLGRTITAAKDTQLAELDAVVQSNKYEKRQYATRRSEVMTGAAWARNTLVTDESGFTPDTTQGKARDIYFTALRDAQNQQPGDVLSGEEFGTAEAAAMKQIKDELGQAGVDALERSFTTGKTQTEREYRTATQAIGKAGYWDMTDDTIEFLNSAAGEARYGNFPFDTYKEFTDFVKEDAKEKGTAPEQSAAWKLVNSLTSKARQIRRINNPELDAMLVTWFGSSPLTLVAQRIAEKNLGRKVALSSDSPDLDK